MEVFVAYFLGTILALYYGSEESAENVSTGSRYRSRRSNRARLVYACVSVSLLLESTFTSVKFTLLKSEDIHEGYQFLFATFTVIHVTYSWKQSHYINGRQLRYVYGLFIYNRLPI